MLIINNLINCYYLLLITATLTVFFFTFRKPYDRLIDLGLLTYFFISLLFGLFNFVNFNFLNLDSINSIYNVIIIPAIFISRRKNWNFFIGINLGFILLCLMNYEVKYDLIIYIISLLLFTIHHFVYQRNFNFLIHNLFLISALVFSFLFDLFFEYQQFWITSHYKYNVFIFYSFFLYIFYIFIIFKYAKS